MNYVTPNPSDVNKEDDSSERPPRTESGGSLKPNKQENKSDRNQQLS
ncbi:MAG: hypothetical protein DSM106950_42815 [Stigonema ocellatum SAG 48.90 = DSM 106950]|nr:hypothetical protein [Stigonema ocellatum SAG 48.90 = DSM 106950]